MPWYAAAATVASAYLNNNGSQNSSGSKAGTTTSQRKISQEGIDKLIYDVLSSDRGLASLAQGENSSGGFGSSTKQMMSQDLVTKLVGELANVTAENVTTTTGTETQRNKKKSPTVICTELMSSCPNRGS